MPRDGCLGYHEEELGLPLWVEESSRVVLYEGLDQLERAAQSLGRLCKSRAQQVLDVGINLLEPGKGLLAGILGA